WSVQRPHKFGNGILGLGEAAVHIVAGIEENKYVGIGGRRDSVLWRLLRDRLALLRHVHLLLQAVAFSESGGLLRNTILKNREIRRMKPSDVVAFVVSHRHIEQY